MASINEAWVTLATSDGYASGALVLAQSLKNHGTCKKCAVLTVPSKLSPDILSALNQAFDHVENVEELRSGDAASLALLGRPELGVTFTKLACWKLTRYSKCVFLDADTLVLKNCDELFEREEFSAAPDPGWPDCFNSGVFVFRPSVETFNNLIELSRTEGSFDGGDQGLLNTYFSDWSSKDISKHLPFIYNMVANATYSYLPAYKKYGNDVKIVHFIGSSKPWLMSSSNHHRPSSWKNYISLWWDIYETNIVPILKSFYDKPRETQSFIETSPLPVVINPPTIITNSSNPSLPSSTSSDPTLPCSTSSMIIVDDHPITDNVFDEENNIQINTDRDSNKSLSVMDIVIEKPNSNDKEKVENYVPSIPLITEDERKRNWESGHPDYQGHHSFDNIWSKIITSLNAEEAAEE